MLLMTSIIAAILTIIFVKLSFAVIGLRRKIKLGWEAVVTMILKELFALKVTLLGMYQSGLS